VQFVFSLNKAVRIAEAGVIGPGSDNVNPERADLTGSGIDNKINLERF